ncbi:MAG: FAD-dependent oxidoreductase, partial [Rhodocyclaceae bacterium]|nr:FAD-dependent oxidoreductase [Rhodocyclaceae bacterium]
SKAMQDRFFRLVEKGKIVPVWDSVVVDVLGDDVIRAVQLENVKSKQRRELACKGLFIAIGHTPNTELFKGVIDLDDKGYVKLGGEGTATNVEGVFAAGDVHDPDYRQAITAAGAGCAAALDAQRWLEEQGIA